MQNIKFSKTKYPRHPQGLLRALRKGWPRTLVLNRAGTAERRARLLDGVATRPGYDRDEYPPAVGRGKGAGLTKGTILVAGVPTSRWWAHMFEHGPQAPAVLQRYEVPVRLL